MTLNEFLGRLKGVRRNGDGWMALCPAHDDRNPSLAVSWKDGRILLHCHAGCSPESVVAALRLRMADLFVTAKQGGNGSGGKRGHEADGQRGPVVAEYIY